MAESVADAETGYGSWFGTGAGSPVVYTRLGQMTAVTPASKTRAVADVTHFESPDEYREFLATFKEGGEWQFELLYRPAVNDTLEDAFEAGTLLPCQFTTKYGIRIQFYAIITELGRTFPLDEKVTRMVTFKVSGPEVRLAAVS
jgi:hypothetical protein